MEPNGAGLIEFWNYAAAKGLVRRDTADTNRSACKVVLSTVEPETWEEMDVSNLDVDVFFQRFERLKLTDLKPESLRQYSQRFRNGISHFLDFLKSPSTWSYPAAEARSTNGSGNDGERKKRSRPTNSKPSQSETSRAHADHAEQSMIDYPYPLRAGLVITVALPADLTKHEAKRLAGFLDSIALEPQLALPAPARPDHEGASER